MSEEQIKPPFGRQGNKYRIREKIIPLIPYHKTYIELFAGSAAIFFNKEKAENNVLNDLDNDTIRRLRLIKSAPTNPDLYRSDLDTLNKIKAFYNTKPTNKAEQILREKIITSTGFGNTIVEGSNTIYKDNNPYNIVKNIPYYKEKLKGVTLSNKDYEFVVKKYDSTNTFFFIDPPYENTRSKFGYAEDKDFDFDRLFRVLANIEGYFLMTINDSSRIRKLFKPFKIKKIDVPVNWQTDNKIRKELIITNYTYK